MDAGGWAESGGRPTDDPPCPSSLSSPLADLVFAFHSAAFLWFTRVWLWHATPAAAALPGSAGFGWFFRYLTFCSFTAQTGALGLCCAAHVAPAGGKAKAKLARAADDASCALFGLANVVTLMYHAIEASTGGVVEGGHLARPPWLGFAVHAGNAATAWADLALGHPRTFSPRAAAASAGTVAAYCAWLLVLRGVHGAFPYPFLNALPMPAGFVGLVAGGAALFWALFQVGRRLSAPLLRVKMRAGWPADA